MQWIKASERVPTVTKYYVCRQNNWSGTIYCDSNLSIKNRCMAEPLLDISLIEWLDESPLPSTPSITEAEAEIEAMAEKEYPTDNNPFNQFFVERDRASFIAGAKAMQSSTVGGYSREQVDNAIAEVNSVYAELKDCEGYGDDWAEEKERLVKVRNFLSSLPLHQINSSGVSVSDAVEFAEWTQREDFTLVFDTGLWGQLGNKQNYTSEQLYQLYLKKTYGKQAEIDKSVGVAEIDFEFAKWVSSSDWTYLPSKQLWYNEEDEHKITPLTTQQLYSKFKYNKP